MNNMKARLTVEYNTNKFDEVEAVKDMINASSWKNLVWEIQSRLYELEKSDDITTKSSYDIIDDIRDLIRTELIHSGLKLD